MKNVMFTLLAVAMLASCAESTEETMVEETVVDMDRPEEGYNDERDYVENGDQPIADDGTQLQVDYGDYGDRAVRDYNDYTPQYDFDEETL